MTYGTSSEAWQSGAGDPWRANTRHNFVQRLADRSLPRACFLHYLAQGYFVLIHFSRALALAVTKADTVEVMRLAAATVNGPINDETALHIGFFAKAGVSETDLFATEERAENLAYTRYVLETGHSDDLLGLLAPCVVGYDQIGTKLSAEATSDANGERIEIYPGSKYKDVCADVGTLIDGAVARLIGDDPQDSPRRASFRNRFATPTRLEVGFWNMGLAP